MVLVFGEPYDKAGQPFQNPFSSRLVLVIELYFGIMCGVGVVLFGRHFRNFITLVVTRSLLLMMLCTFLIRGFTGIFNFLGLHKIGKRNTSTPFQILSILCLLINGEGKDKLCWKPAGNKYFKVSEFYLSLSSTPITSFPWKFVWCPKIPHRVAFFSWTAALRKILTLENLWYKGVAVIDWCYMCKKSGESANHLLLHCPIA